MIPRRRVLHLMLIFRGHLIAIAARRGCRLVRELSEQDGLPGAAALVRGERYTSVLHSGCTYAGAKCSAKSLDPQCSSDANECTEARCSVLSDSGIDVRWSKTTKSFEYRAGIYAENRDSIDIAVCKMARHVCDAWCTLW